MNETILIVIGIIAGVLVGVLSNWIYDLLKAAGVFPDKPTLKRLIIILLSFLPLICLVALPELISPKSSNNSSSEDAYIEVKTIVPSPEDTVLVSDVETLIIVNAKYYLPTEIHSPEIKLEYLTSAIPNDFGKSHWYVIQSYPAEIGVHYIQIAGEIRPPVRALLNEEPFRIRILLSGLDGETGEFFTIASETIIFALEDD